MKRSIAALGALLFAFAFSDAKAGPEETHYRETAIWAVSYSDAKLGLVEGRAICDWSVPLCHLKLRNPKTGEVLQVNAAAKDIHDSVLKDNRLVIKFSGKFPSGPKTAPPPQPSHSAGGGGTGQIIVKSGDAEQTVKVPVAATATADTDTLTFTLDANPGLDFNGDWSYFADPLTERFADGSGPVGSFDTIRDEDVPGSAGGFLGRETGGVMWRPLPAVIYAVFMIEDQAAYNGASPEYFHAGAGHSANDSRTLVVIGRDLPVDENKIVQDIGSHDDGVSYKLLAVHGAKGESKDDQAKFERAFREYTKDMAPDDAAKFRRLNAALVKVTLDQRADAGEKNFDWGAASGHWYLQYGDNVASVSFVREFNAKERETTSVLALPERVVIEVDAPGGTHVASVPVILGGPAIAGGPRKLVAHMVAPGRYTVPVTFRSNGGGGDSVQVTPGGRIFAAVDISKTDFLRAGMAEAVGRPPSTMWIDALKQAATCNKASFNPNDWPRFASKPAQSLSYKGQKVDINYGDHAGMLLLRQALVPMLQSQLAQLDDATSDDGLAMAWRRSMHDLVTQTPEFPLADYDVQGGVSGVVPFRTVYSESYRDQNFQVWTTPDGWDRYNKWVRTASREAMKEYRKEIAESLARARQIDPCDRLELLDLVGSGFKNVSAQIAPLLMKPSPDGLSEPDRVARAYTRELDTLNQRLHAAQEWSSLVTKDVVIVATSLAGPVAGAIWGVSAGASVALAGGLAMFGYESAYEIQHTYKSQEEVRFAFSTASTIGVDRYFEAKAQETKWWQTGLSIFGQAVLLGIASSSALEDVSQLAEDISVWRGERLYLKFKDESLSGVRNLSPRQQRDLSLYVLKNQEKIAATRVVSVRSDYVARTFDELGAEASGAAPKSAPEDVLQAPAFDPEDGIQTAQIAPPQQAPAATAIENEAIRAAKTEIAEAENLRELETSIDEQEQEVVAEAAEEPPPKPAEPKLADTVKVEAELLDVDVKKAVATADGMPVPFTTFHTTIDGKPVSFEIGKVISESSLFFNVYELKSLPVGVELDQELGTDLVLKVLKKNDKVLNEQNEMVPGIKDHVVERMLQAQKRLETTKAPFMKIQGWDDVGIIVQKRYRPKEGQFELFDVKNGWDRVKNVFKPNKDMHRAVARLYQQLIDADLIWLDGHIGNIYFELKDGQWVAGVLDQDLLGTYEEINSGVYGAWQEGIKFSRRAKSVGMPGDLKYTTVKSSMQKMLENKGWLKFDPVEKTLDPGLIDPVEVKSIMQDLPYVPEKQGWLDPGRRIHYAMAPPRASPANDNSHAHRRAA